MDTQVMIGDNSIAVGLIMAEAVKKRGLIVRCFRNRGNVLRDMLNEEPSAVAIGIFYRDFDKVCENISALKREFPKSRIVIGAFCYRRSELMQFIDAGADYCFGMPMQTDIVMRNIMEMVSGNWGDRLSAEGFLRACGMPEKKKGFRYLAEAVRICTDDTSALSGRITGVYRSIAEKYRSEAGAVERSMRSFAAEAEENGSIRYITQGRTRKSPANKELMAMSCDAYVEFLRSRKKKK